MQRRNVFNLEPCGGSRYNNFNNSINKIIFITCGYCCAALIAHAGKASSMAILQDCYF